MASSVDKSHDSGAVPKLDSSGSDSLGFAAALVNNFAPSMASSGYASQAVSIQTLSSEDSGSVKSIGTDDIIVELSVEKKSAGSEDAVVEKDMSTDHGDNDCVTADVNLERALDGMLAAGGSSEQDIDLCVSETCRSAEYDLENSDSVNKRTTDAPEAERESVGSGSSGPGSDGSSTMSETLSTHEDEVAADNRQVLSDATLSTHEDDAVVPTDATLKPAEETVDFYSETAMDELERLSDDAENTSAVKNDTCSADPVAQNHTCDDDADDIPLQHTNDDSVNSEGVKSQSMSEAPPNSRRNLSDELESVAPIINGGRFPEIKPGVNFGGKGANFKKIRTAADSRASKGGVSPVKATYRPTSMTQEMMMSLEEALQPEEEEETHNSGSLLYDMADLSCCLLTLVSARPELSALLKTYTEFSFCDPLPQPCTFENVDF